MSVIEELNEEVMNGENTVEAEGFEVIESEEKANGKTVAIIAATAILGAGIGVGGYYIYKHHISKTGRIDWQEKRLEKMEKKMTKKLAKEMEKLDKFKAEVKPKVVELNETEENETEK